MTTAFISHPVCALHDMGPQHLDYAARLEAIENSLNEAGLLKKMHIYKALPASREHLLLAHDVNYIDLLMSVNQRRVDSLMAMDGGNAAEQLACDTDIDLNEYSMQAAEFAAGSVIQGVDLTMTRCADNVFCSVRPPGHHAGKNHAAGDCIINNVMVGARYAKLVYHLNRIAIIDIDATYGFGTEDIVKGNPEFLYISVFQHDSENQDRFTEKYDNIKRFPMMPKYNGTQYEMIFKKYVLPAIRTYKPEMIFISAGFNAHKKDKSSSLRLNESDYYWITQRLMTEARMSAEGRIISVLEGGYNLEALGRSVNQHISALMGLREIKYS